MTAPDLLTEITQAFQNEPYPESPAAALTGNQAVLQGVAWPELPDAALREQLAASTLENPAGFRYYLPAFLCFMVREPEQQGVASLLGALKLPVELSGPEVKQLLVRFQSANPPTAAEVTAIVQQQLAQTNQALNRFIARASLLSSRQATAVYHFLTYWCATSSTAASRQLAAVALERYWFQFATERDIAP